MLRDERLQQVVAEVDAAPDRERVRAGTLGGWVGVLNIGYWHCHHWRCRTLPQRWDAAPHVLPQTSECLALYCGNPLAVHRDG